jgi:hypothetical protein
MNATRRGGLSLVVVAAALSAMAGCADSAGLMSAPKAPPAPEPVSMGEHPMPAASSAPIEPGYAPSQQPRASMEREAGKSWSGPRQADKRAEESPAPPADRPGLGTQWGETRVSRISTVSFERADESSPFASAMLFYNDEQGARAMSSTAGFRRTTGGAFRVANGLVSIGLREDTGRFFGGFVSGERDYVVGESGHRYTIVVRNNTDSRLEVVLSVDGLDVLDGKSASFEKRGYIVDPRAELEVDGFRQSTDTVAAFRFGSVRGSYAGQKHGDTRNVGVIGVALFNERGTRPFPWTNEEVQRRHNANPFPGTFATPPGT